MKYGGHYLGIPLLLGPTQKILRFRWITHFIVRYIFMFEGNLMGT